MTSLGEKTRTCMTAMTRGFPFQENGVIRMKSFANWYPARNMPVHQRRGRADDGVPALFFAHEALTNEGFGKRHRSSSEGKPDIIFAGVEMMEMHGLKRSQYSANHVASRAGGLDLLPAAISSLCEEIL